MKYRVTSSILFLLLSGCVLAPAIDSVKRAGVLEGDRQNLLSQEIKHFSDVMSLGQPTKMLEFVAADRLSQIAPDLKKNFKNEKIVDCSVDDVQFSNDSYDADVKVRIKYYKVPVYVVDERLEHQRWTFSSSTGWKIYEREKLDSKG